MISHHWSLATIRPARWLALHCGRCWDAPLVPCTWPLQRQQPYAIQCLAVVELPLLLAAATTREVDYKAQWWLDSQNLMTGHDSP